MLLLNIYIYFLQLSFATFEQPYSAVALIAPITSNRLITFIKDEISSPFSRSQFLSILTISRVLDGFSSLTIARSSH